MFGDEKVTFENIAKSIGMFIDNSNSINNEIVEKEIDKAKNTMDLFLNSGWD